MLDPDWEKVLEPDLVEVPELVPEWELGSDLMVFGSDLEAVPDLVVDPEPAVAMLLGSD